MGQGQGHWRGQWRDNTRPFSHHQYRPRHSYHGMDGGAFGGLSSPHNGQYFSRVFYKKRLHGEQPSQEPLPLPIVTPDTGGSTGTGTVSPDPLSGDQTEVVKPSSPAGGLGGSGPPTRPGEPAGVRAWPPRNGISPFGGGKSYMAQSGKISPLSQTVQLAVLPAADMGIKPAAQPNSLSAISPVIVPAAPAEILDEHHQSRKMPVQQSNIMISTVQSEDGSCHNVDSRQRPQVESHQPPWSNSQPAVQLEALVAANTERLRATQLEDRQQDSQEMSDGVHSSHFRNRHQDSPEMSQNVHSSQMRYRHQDPQEMNQHVQTTQMRYRNQDSLERSQPVHSTQLRYRLQDTPEMNLHVQSSQMRYRNQDSLEMNQPVHSTQLRERHQDTPQMRQPVLHIPSNPPWTETDQMSRAVAVSPPAGVQPPVGLLAATMPPLGQLNPGWRCIMTGPGQLGFVPADGQQFIPAGGQLGYVPLSCVPFGGQLGYVAGGGPLGFLPAGGQFETMLGIGRPQSPSGPLPPFFIPVDPRTHQLIGMETAENELIIWACFSLKFSKPVCKYP